MAGIRDIKDFTKFPSLSDDDLLLGSKTSLGGTDASITVANFKNQVAQDVEPSINENGYWVVNGVNTGKKAEGSTPILEGGFTTTGEPGSQASSSIVLSGETPEGLPRYIINLTIPRGITGNDGKTSQFKIGTVENGNDASASISFDGEDEAGNPVYKINLVLPKGEIGNPGIDGTDGIDGKTPKFEAGAVTTLDPGEPATAQITFKQNDTDGSPIYTISLSIPKGDTGDSGKTPILESVSAISGETPSGSFSQAGVDESGNPKYILNLSLPKGKDGQPAVFEAGTTTTLAPSAEASVEVVPNGETPNGNPKYILNFFIPRGETGLPGAGSGNVSAEGAGLIAGKKYFFVPDASDSTSGRFVEYVDGPGSGIDADLLDGKQGSDYMLASDAGKFVKTTGFNTITTDTNDVSLIVNNTANNPRIQFNLKGIGKGTIGSVSHYLNGIGFTNMITGVQFGLHDTYGLSIYDTDFRKVWHEANDGAGSGLDADLLDGKQGSEYALKTEIPDTIPDAPADGKTYGRKNEAWAEIKDGVYVLDLDAIVGDSPSGPITQEQYNSVAEAYNKHSTTLKLEGLYMNCSILLQNDEYLLIIPDTAPLFGFPGEGISLSYLFITINSSSYSSIDRSISFRGPNGAGLGTKFLSDNGEYLTPPTATSTTAGYMSSSDKQRLDSALVLKNVTTASTLSNLSIANYSIKVTLSAASALSFASTPAEGWECMIDIKNSSASNITQPLPNASGWQCDDTSITIAAGKIASISVRYIHGTYVVIAKGN